MIASTPAALNLRDAVAHVISELDAPLNRSELIARVLSLHPSRSRHPGGMVMAEVRQSAALVHLEDDTFAPLAFVLQGVQFRYAPTPEELASGVLCTFPCFVPFLTAPAPTLIEEANGCPLPSLRAWFSNNGVEPGDSLLFTVADARRGVFGVRHERAGDADRAALAIQDATLEATLYGLVAKDPSGQPFLEEILPAALARLHAAARDYPGRHWHAVVARSTRLRLVDDYAIARATFRRPIDRLRGYGASPATQQTLEAAIDALNRDVARALPPVRPGPAGPAPNRPPAEEALERSAGQIAAFLRRHSTHAAECHRCLALPSVYLAQHEGVSLAEAKAEMLARFLLSFYPRRVLFNRKAFTARMLTVLRHFYAESPTVDPHVLSRLHRLVDRKVALFSELERNAPDAARLFEKLFPEVESTGGTV